MWAFLLSHLPTQLSEPAWPSRACWEDFRLTPKAIEILRDRCYVFVSIIQFTNMIDMIYRLWNEDNICLCPNRKSVCQRLWPFLMSQKIGGSSLNLQRPKIENIRKWKMYHFCLVDNFLVVGIYWEMTHHLWLIDFFHWWHLSGDDTSSPFGITMDGLWMIELVVNRIYREMMHHLQLKLP